MPGDEQAPLLDIRGLKTHFATDDGMVQAVDGVDITIGRGETVGVVGESGCGKTVTALSVLKLIAIPPGKIVAGQILYQGRDLVPLGTAEMDRIRAKDIAMVFQEPMTSLNPVYTIGEQIAEVLRKHEGLGRKAAIDKTVEMLRLVQIPESRQALQRLSAPVLRRHAPARHDRDGALLQPETPDRRRADHRARRDDPGADPRIAAGHESALRHGDHADHPCDGRRRRNRAARRRDVRRQGDRGSASRPSVRRSAPSLHAGPDPLDPAHRHGGDPQGAARGHSGGGAEPAQSSARLPLRRALQATRCRNAARPCRRLLDMGGGHKVACVLCQPEMVAEPGPSRCCA